MRSLVFAACLAGLLGTASASAQQPLTILGQVLDESDRPVAGVVVRILGVGEDRTTSTGEFQIRLSTSLRPGDPVEVRLVPDTWVVKNHFRNTLILPRGLNQVVPVIVARRGSLSLLNDAAIRKIVEDASVKAVPAAPGSDGAAPSSVHEGVAARVKELGIEVQKAKEVIDAWAARISPTDPYGEGLAAYYTGDLAKTIDRMDAARKAQRDQFVNASIVIGKAHLAMFNFRAAAAAFGEGVELDPLKGEALLGRRAACLVPSVFENMGVPAAERPECAEDVIQATEAAMIAIQNAVPRDDLLEANALVALAIFSRTDRTGPRQRALQALKDLHQRLQQPAGVVQVRALLLAADAADTLEQPGLAGTMREEAGRASPAGSAERAMFLFLKAVRMPTNRWETPEWMDLVRQAASLCAALPPVAECAYPLAVFAMSLVKLGQIDEGVRHFELADVHVRAGNEPMALIRVRLQQAEALSAVAGMEWRSLDQADAALDLGKTRVPNQNFFVRLLVHGGAVGKYYLAVRRFEQQGAFADVERCYLRLFGVLEKASATDALAGALESFSAWLERHGRADEAAPYKARAVALRKG